MTNEKFRSLDHDHKIDIVKKMDNSILLATIEDFYFDAMKLSLPDYSKETFASGWNILMSELKHRIIFK